LQKNAILGHVDLKENILDIIGLYNIILCPKNKGIYISK
jgi:hypothetical protein